MEEFYPELISLSYGLAYFTMGMALGVRALAFPSSAFRNRLLALGAFGIFHSGAVWTAFALALESTPPFFVRDMIFVPSALALYYFAFGWNRKQTALPHVIAAASITALLVLSPFIQTHEMMEVVTRALFPLPAAICAGTVLLLDRSFRSDTPVTDYVRWLVAAGFLVLSGLHLISILSNLYPLSILTSGSFEAAADLSMRVARGSTILIITIGTLFLLNHFDSVMRRQAETALASADTKLRRVLEITGLGSWEWDIVEDKAIWSDQMCAIFGMRPDRKGLNYAFFLDHIHPDDREHVDRTVRACFETHEPYRTNFRVVADDGKVRFVDARGEVEFGAGGEPVRMSGSMLDISELEMTRAALHERDAKLSRILEAAPEAIIIADEQGRIVLFNEGAQGIFGYTPEETVGQTIAMLIPERFQAAHSGHVRGFASCGDVQKRMGDRNEIAGVRKNGEEFPARATISKLETADGLIYSVWLRDVTRSKAIREELLAAKAAAEAASAAKSNFIANMSHELRTPLNAILGFSEVMGMETFGPLGHGRYREYIEDIKKSGEHLLSIINDILNISQLEAGKMQLTDVEAVDVIELVEDCIKWVSPKAAAAGVELAFDGGDDIPALRGERRLLTQVLLNLLSNAVKFSPKGGTVEITAEEDADNRVRISVRDTGVGMRPEQIACIGEPFLQFGEARSRKFEGTGLGLSIAKRLVELHGGKLEGSSAPNEGTIFTMIMPAEMPASRSADTARAVWA